MEKAQNLVVTHSKSNHVAASQLSAGEKKTHSDIRFYTHSSKLVNSIKAEKVQVSVNGLKGEVTASEPYATAVELGGANRRAFPFMGPALTGTAVEQIALFIAAIKKVIK